MEAKQEEERIGKEGCKNRGNLAISLSSSPADKTHNINIKRHINRDKHRGGVRMLVVLT